MRMAEIAHQWVLAYGHILSSFGIGGTEEAVIYVAIVGACIVAIPLLNLWARADRVRKRRNRDPFGGA